MNKSTKAALLSGLVFPGLGQFYVKKPFLGAVFIFSGALGILGLGTGIYKRLIQAVEHLNQLIAQGELIDFSTIVSISTQTVSGGDSFLLEKLGVLLLIISWSLSIIHALWKGPRDKDSRNVSPSRLSLRD